MINSKFQVPGSRLWISKPGKNLVPQSLLAPDSVFRRQNPPATFNLELGTLLACAACFGRSDSPLAHGMNWGIFTLMGVIVTVLASIATFFFFVVRKEIALNKNQNPPLQNPIPNPANV